MRQYNKLTQEQVDDENLPIGKYFDGHGLILRVDKQRRKQWVLRITVQGRRREMGLGSPRYVSLEEARGMAKAYTTIAKRGGDPIEVRNMS